MSLPPALLGSCSRQDPEPSATDGLPTVPAAPDSVITKIRFLSDGIPVRRLDIFIYDAGGTQELERHLQLDSLCGELSLPTTAGAKLLVGIANSPYNFNLHALARYDAIRQLSYRFSDDCPEYPIASDACTTSGQSGQLSLHPLLCCVELSSVCNTLDGYVLLEDPQVRLVDLPDGAEVLREKEFRPTALIDAGTWVALPYDVGYFPQQPGIRLWCYPNDTPENVLGTPRPTLQFACSIEGEACTFDVPLPPLSRGSTKRVELTIDGPEDCRYAVW